jgi:hypothetical protein
MAVYPRTTEFGIATAWETSDRPTNAPHGFSGWNETLLQMEVYDAITATWYTTVSMLAVAFYP